MYGYRQEHHAEAGGMGKAARPQSGAQDHYPQGHAGTVSDGQSGRKTIIRRDTLERFLTVNQGRNLLKPDDVRRVE